MRESAGADSRATTGLKHPWHRVHAGPSVDRRLSSYITYLVSYLYALTRELHDATTTDCLGLALLWQFARDCAHSAGAARSISNLTQKIASLEVDLHLARCDRL